MVVFQILLVLAAVLLLLLRAFGVSDGGSVDLGWLGLALYALSSLLGFMTARVVRPVA